MIHHVVQFALRQRFLVLMLTLLVVVAGALSFQRMPVDAYPDLSPLLAPKSLPNGRGMRLRKWSGSLPCPSNCK